MNPPVVPLTPSTNPLVVDDSSTQDASDQTKGDGAPQDLLAS